MACATPPLKAAAAAALRRMKSSGASTRVTASSTRGGRLSAGYVSLGKQLVDKLQCMVHFPNLTVSAYSPCGQLIVTLLRPQLRKHVPTANCLIARKSDHGLASCRDLS